MSSIFVEFAEALGAVSRPAAFYVAGTQQLLAPGLEVEGVGPVALPLLPFQAEALIAVAERAPYGRGEDTVTDIAVRRTWQIAPDRVRIKGRHWPNTVKAIIDRVTEGLGVTGQVDAALYKLLVYDRGSFFVPHRDTEKVPGMFATLVLALPAVAQGGELIVRHNDREARLELRGEDASDLAFAAFYADCVHEVLPVTAGYRLVLIYNLIRRGAGKRPVAANYDAEQNVLAKLLKHWAATPRTPEVPAPEKLIYQLQHAYTPAELAFDTLKGADAAIAQVVVAAARQSGCDVHLALVSIEESGSAVQTGGSGDYRRGRYRDDDDDEFEVVDVDERLAVASYWRRADGQPSPLTEIPVVEDEFSPPLSFEDVEPDEEHFHEATGNEGASFERTYSRAALILWPHDRLLAVINQAGLTVTLPFLSDLAKRWEEAGDPAVLEQAWALSRHMVAAWPKTEWHSQPGEASLTDAGRFLNVLRRLKDTEAIESLLAAMRERHGFASADCAAIEGALRALPVDRAAPLLKGLIETASRSALGACANLLARLAGTAPPLAAPAGRALVAALPGDPASDTALPPWRRTRVTPELIVDLFTALGRIDPTLAAVAADHVLEWPKTYDFDTILIPATSTLVEQSKTAGDASVRQLRDACVAHLDARIALKLEPPADWRRDTTLDCNCRDCQTLKLFLADATQKAWTFAAAEPRRRHVETMIRRAQSDVAMTTERRGSPHRLICTKTQASYERRRSQRAKDLTQRQRLMG